MNDLTYTSQYEMRRWMMPLLIFASLLAIALAVAWSAGVLPLGSSGERETTNKQLIQSAFDHWQAGTGGPFDLLADEAHWTIVGSSPVSRTYDSKELFLAEVIRPFNARMEKPLRPTVQQIHADGDTVVILFEAESLCLDGLPYRNTYAWFMQMKEGRIVKVTAFFDTRLFDEMWKRVSPR